MEILHTDWLLLWETKKDLSSLPYFFSTSNIKIYLDCMHYIIYIIHWMKHVQISMALKLLCTSVDLYVHVLKARVLIIMILTRLKENFWLHLTFQIVSYLVCKVSSLLTLKMWWLSRGTNCHADSILQSNNVANN